MVTNIKITSQACPLFIAEVPSIMKITVSVILLNILRKYFIVVCDFSDILKMTYCFITMPQKVNLKTARCLSIQLLFL